MNSHSQADGILGDYCDAKQFKESKLFQKHPCALQIQLFYDELEVCNPLGSKAKKHKLAYTVNDESLVGLNFGKSAKKSIWWKKVWQISFSVWRIKFGEIAKFAKLSFTV